MMRPRIIPVLLLRGEGLVKGIRFKDYEYIGDPINAVHIFNEKEVDELAFLDINATRENRTPGLEFIEKIADECYMPFAVGGGIRSIQEIRDILYAGAEKVSLNTSAVENPALIRETADRFGSQSVVVSIDYKKVFGGGSRVFTHAGSKKTGLDPLKWAVQAAEAGAGEILLNSIDRDGTMEGYDLEMISKISNSVSVPVIACGGAGKVDDFGKAVENGASAAAAGAMFVFHGRMRAVLINYPAHEELSRVFNETM